MSAVQLSIGFGVLASALLVIVLFCDFWRHIPRCHGIWFGLRRWTGHAAFDGSPEAYDMVFRNAGSVELVRDPEMARQVRDFKLSYRYARECGDDRAKAYETALKRLRAVLPESRHADWPYGNILEQASR